MSRDCVLVVGESLVDEVLTADGRTHARPGGSPMNVAVGLARLDVPTVLHTDVGTDAYGRLVTGHLAESGVRRAHPSTSGPARTSVARTSVARTSVARTSVARATVDADGHASYTFDLHWDPGPLALDDPPAAVHVGSLGTVVAPGELTVRELLAGLPPDVPVTYDPNIRPALQPDPETAWRAVAGWAARADVVKLSADDAAYLRPRLSAEQLVRLLLDPADGPAGRTSLVVLTLGADGALLATAEHVIRAAAPKVAVVDTVGAGDAFMAGLLAALHDQRLLHRDRLTQLGPDQLLAAGTWAAGIAAITCGRVGADPPRRAELDPVREPEART